MLLASIFLFRRSPMRYEEYKLNKLTHQYSPSPNPTSNFSAKSNQSYIALLDIAYYAYRKFGLVKDQQQFSERVLGRAQSYLSCMRARKRTPSQPVLFHLLQDAKLQCNSIAANQHFGMPYAESLNRAHKEFAGLIRIMEEQLVTDD
jgi:hypothetical protein